MSDRFFEEEGAPESTSQPSAPQQSKSSRGRETKPAERKASGKTGHASSSAAPSLSGKKQSKKKPPSFAMAVGIAVVALLLGFALGYYTALGALSHRIEELYAGYETMGESAHQEAMTSAASESSTSTNLNEEADLPEGHPDLSSLLNDDGSVNEEALAQYKAQRAQESADQDSE